MTDSSGGPATPTPRVGEWQSRAVAQSENAAPGMTRTGENLTKFAWLSIAAALVTIALKFGAYLLTGSVGLLSDAAESVVNLVAAIVALIALTIAARPADDSHHFGHTKAEYFSAVVEGAMILVAAAAIIWSAAPRLWDPQPIENVSLGLGISVVASVVNGLVAWVLIRAGREHRSITLEADGKHLLTDVWTSVGVVAAVLVVALTGWLILDPIIAIAVALNIVVAGYQLISRSVTGLMDGAMDDESLARIEEILDGFRSDEVSFHAVRTRVAGRRHFVSMHVLVPGDWSVQRGHDLCDEVERNLFEALEGCEVSTHLEPVEDPASYRDEYAVVDPPSRPEQPPDGAGDLGPA